MSREGSVPKKYGRKISVSVEEGIGAVGDYTRDSDIKILKLLQYIYLNVLHYKTLTERNELC